MSRRFAKGTLRAESRRTEALAVLLLIRSLALGGAERQLVELAAGLQRRGHRVVVSTFYPGGLLALDLQQAGISVIELHKHGRWDVFSFGRRLRRAIREVRPDVLYTFVGGANIFGAILRPFIGSTKVVWSIRASNMDLSQYDWAHRLAYLLEQRLARAADLIISNSNAGVEFAVGNGFPRARIAVVSNGIDTSRFRPDPVLRKQQRERWGLEVQDIAVGMLARLDPMKGHSHFLKAAARILAVRGELKFLCIGDGREEARLKALTAELGIAQNVLFVGPTSDAPAALNGLDLYCSASITEGFSNAIAEAMACGLRCVVTDVGDSASIVGDCGVVVPPSNPAALAEAIIGQIGTLDCEFSRGRARIIANYSVSSMVDRTIDLLQKVVDGQTISSTASGCHGATADGSKGPRAAPCR